MCDFMVHRTHLYKPRLSSILSLAHHHHQNTSSNHLLAVLRSDHSIELWNTHDSFTLERTIQPLSASQSPELVLWLQQYLITAGLDGHLIAYDPITFEILTSCHAAGGAIWSIAKHEATRRIAIGTETGHVNIYQLDEVTLVRCTSRLRYTTCLCFRMPVSSLWRHQFASKRHVSCHWRGTRMMTIFSSLEVSTESTFVRHAKNGLFNR